MTGRSDDEILQAMWPGSTRIFAPVLCPCCGWHFAKGFTDPEGTQVELKPGFVTICGECVAILKFDANLQPVHQTPELLAQWPRNELKQIAAIWRLTFVARHLRGNEGNDANKGTQQ
jgi:hypothetical protein